jgi:hypothetical protein
VSESRGDTNATWSVTVMRVAIGGATNVTVWATCSP